MATRADYGKISFWLWLPNLFRHKTNRYNDEHLAELIQAINRTSDPADFLAMRFIRGDRISREVIRLLMHVYSTRSVSFGTELMQPQFQAKRRL